MSTTIISSKQFLVSIVIIFCTFLLNSFLKLKFFKDGYFFLQLVYDSLISFLLLFVNGGIQNPFCSILIIQVFLASFFLSTKRSVILISVNLFFFLGLQLSPYRINLYSDSSFTNYSTSIGLMLVSLIIWQISYWLVKELKTLYKRVESLQVYGQRIDHFRSLGLLTSGICHELGTPLNTSLIKLDRLISSVDNDSKPDLDTTIRNLKKCSDSLKKLNTQIHNIEDGQYHEIVYYKDFITEICKEYQKVYPLKINLELNINNDLHYNLPKLLLTRNIVDLLDNSYEAKSSQVFVSAHVEDNKDYICIDFYDNGEGFSKEMLKNIGSPFATSKDTGTGLGLYHLIQSIRYMGGETEIENKNSHAFISIRLPLEKNL